MTYRLCFIMLTSLLLTLGCQSAAERDSIAATAIAAEIFATQTATAPTETAIPTATPQPTDTPVPLATPAPTRTPEPTPTTLPETLSPADIFALISPSVPYIDVPSGTGSGILMANGYILTNAHVVWPHHTARVVFADGQEFLDVPVLNTDVMVDLAILGPIEIDAPPLAFGDGENLGEGSPVYLIGYPGEGESFPRPTIATGIISRIRESEVESITYFQTDAASGGGQSGGALISERGELIGLTTFSVAADNFILASSTVDIAPRVARLIEGDDVDQLGNREIAASGGETRFEGTLATYWDVALYMLEAPVGTDVSVKIDGDNDLAIDVVDVYAYEIGVFDEDVSGTEQGEFTIDFDIPHFIVVYQFTEAPARYTLTSTYPLRAVFDPDDGQSIGVDDATIRASLDGPGDVDVFYVNLSEGESIDIQARSTAVDPVIFVDYVGATEDEIADDDDSGGGIFGTDARLTYTAPRSGRFFIVIFDAFGDFTGGYTLDVRSAP